MNGRTLAGKIFPGRSVDDTLGERLRRYDAVAQALREGGEEPRLIYVDNRARPDRVTVKLASAAAATHPVRN